MKIYNNEFEYGNLIKLKDQDWLDKQRIAGKVLAKTLILLENLVKEKTTKSLIELDKIAEDFIIKNKCIPTFKGYKGFPNSCCISVNKQLVHGIPNNYKLQDGDLISFDLGATLDGVITDSAITCIFGMPKSNRHINLINATEASLIKGIESIKIGKQLGCIGEAIYKYARNNNFSVINKYGGHGLELNAPHAPPFVSNKDISNNGIRFQSNMTLAIEPMLTFGSTDTIVDKDGWTVWCDAEASAHYEHTIYIHEDNKIEILTDRSNIN